MKQKPEWEYQQEQQLSSSVSPFMLAWRPMEGWELVAVLPYKADDIDWATFIWKRRIKQENIDN